MSFELAAAVWSLKIPATEKMVLMCLCDRANGARSCWPGADDIAERCSLTERTVRKCIGWLNDQGWIKVEKRDGKCSIYRIDPGNKFTPELNAPLNDVPDTPEANSGHPGSKFRRTNKEPINNQSEKKTRAHSLPADWNPEPFTAGTKSREIVDEWPPGTFDETLEAFRAHHQARGGKFKDWQQAWSTWVLNSRKFSNGRKPQQHRANRSSAREIGERIAHELASKTSAAANW